VCLRIGEEGGAVACVDIDGEGAEKTAATIRDAGGRAWAARCDVADEDSVRDTVAGVVAELGPPDVLCNVAGIGRFQHSTEAPLADWNRILGVNLTGPFLMSRETLPHLLERGGNIVNVASSAGLMAQMYSAAYCASKGGLIMLTKALSAEYVKRGVRVNVIAPGGMDTPLIESFGFPEGASIKDFAKITSPLGYAAPEDVANAVVFVASDEAKFMTGSVVSVDGGITA
jgi:NAD(P)-dependent dehydrogenase (short-subunit alcohol dehydrogenase family)